MNSILQRVFLSLFALTLAFGALATPVLAQNCGAGQYYDGVSCRDNPTGGDKGSTFDPANPSGDGVTTLLPAFGFSNLSQTINTIITAIMFFAAVVAFVFIVIGAFRYVSAGEDAAGTKAARTIITNAVVGLILVALVYVIFQIVIRIVPGLSAFFVNG